MKTGSPVRRLKDSEAWTWVLAIVWKRTEMAADRKLLGFGADLVSCSFIELPH